MKVLSVIHSMNLSEGGPPEVLRNQAEIINQKKKTVYVFPIKRFTKYYFFSLLFSSKKRNKLKKFLTKFNIIHFHIIWSIRTIILIYFSRKLSVKHLYVGHGYLDQWSINERYLKKKLFIILFLQSAYNSSSGSFFSTKDELIDAKNNININNAFIIPNGVNLDFYKQKKYIDKKIKKIIFFGRIHKKKGIDILLEAIEKLDDIFFKEFIFEITGPSEAEYIKFIKKKILDMKLSNKVILNDPISRKNKNEYISNSDIFILPSFEEGDSIALKEAMAVGLPVIISKHCRMDLVEDFKAGIIIKKTTSEEIKKALIKMKDMNLEQLGKNGRFLMEKYYKNETCANRLLDIYVDIHTGSRNSDDWVN